LLTLVTGFATLAIPRFRDPLLAIYRGVIAATPPAPAPAAASRDLGSEGRLMFCDQMSQNPATHYEAYNFTETVRRLNLSLTNCQTTERHQHQSDKPALFDMARSGLWHPDGAVKALSGGMPMQLNRMQALGARVSLPVDQDGMGQHGADLDGARRSNRSY
jgi:hypothetical protein